MKSRKGGKELYMIFFLNKIEDKPISQQKWETTDIYNKEQET